MKKRMRSEENKGEDKEDQRRWDISINIGLCSCEQQSDMLPPVSDCMATPCACGRLQDYNHAATVYIPTSSLNCLIGGERMKWEERERCQYKKKKKNNIGRHPQIGRTIESPHAIWRSITHRVVYTESFYFTFSSVSSFSHKPSLKSYLRARTFQAKKYSWFVDLSSEAMLAVRRYTLRKFTEKKI